MVITQDPELDDVNMVIRALLYSTDVRLEGLIYPSANFHFRGDGKGTTQPGEVVIPGTTSLDSAFQIPSDAQPGQTIHVILEASDSGTPSLTRYQRVIVTVGPAAP